MKRLIISYFFVVLSIVTINAQENDTLQVNNDNIVFNENDLVNAHLSASFILDGKEHIEKTFGHPFIGSITIYLFNSRNSLDKAFQTEWNMPEFKTQCWMVASGISDKIYLLSPAVWEKEACEHNPNDLNKMKKLFIHELVHSYHAQYNPNKNMEGFSEMSWFVEGLAVFVSGQFEDDEKQRVKDLNSNNELPVQLSQFWKGKNRYVVSGSIINYLFDKYGVETIFECLKFQSTTKILNYLDTTEEKLILEWKKSI